MSDDTQNFIDQIRSGNLDLSAIEKISDESDRWVTISNWNLCSSGHYLMGSCTLTAKTQNNITEAFLIITKGQAGPVMFSMNTKGLNESTVDIYADTSLYDPDMGSSFLFIVYGWVQNGEGFQFFQTMPVGSC